jgi:hypothetical protein
MPIHSDTVYGLKTKRGNWVQNFSQDCFTNKNQMTWRSVLLPSILLKKEDITERNKTATVSKLKHTDQNLRLRQIKMKLEQKPLRSNFLNV